MGRAFRERSPNNEVDRALSRAVVNGPSGGGRGVHRARVVRDALLTHGMPSSVTVTPFPHSYQPNQRAPSCVPARKTFDQKLSYVIPPLSSLLEGGAETIEQHKFKTTTPVHGTTRNANSKP